MTVLNVPLSATPAPQPRQGDTSQPARLFEAGLMVAKEKKSTLTNVIEGLGQGLTLASNIQKIQSNEITLRQQEANLTQTNLANESLIELQKERRAGLEVLKMENGPEKIYKMAELQRTLSSKTMTELKPAIQAEMIMMERDAKNKALLDSSGMTDIYFPERKSSAQERAAAIQMQKLKGEQAMARTKVTAGVTLGKEKLRAVGAAGKESAEQRKKNINSLNKTIDKQIDGALEQLYASETPMTDESGLPLGEVFKRSLAETQRRFMQSGGNPVRIGNNVYETFDDAKRDMTIDFLAAIDEEEAERALPVEAQNLRRMALIQKANQRREAEEAARTAQEDGQIASDDQRTVPSPEQARVQQRIDTARTTGVPTGTSGARYAELPASVEQVNVNRTAAGPQKIQDAQTIRKLLNRYKVPFAPATMSTGRMAPVREIDIRRAAERMANTIVTLDMARYTDSNIEGTPAQRRQKSIEAGARKKELSRILFETYYARMRQMVALGE